jgi:hypothetical protein
LKAYWQPRIPKFEVVGQASRLPRARFSASRPA